MVNLGEEEIAKKKFVLTKEDVRVMTVDDPFEKARSKRLKTLLWSDANTKG